MNYTTRYSRTSKPPVRFEDEKFLPGSGKKGEINGVHFDAYDKSYNGYDILNDTSDSENEEVSFNELKPILEESDEETDDTDDDSSIDEDNKYSQLKYDSEDETYSGSDISSELPDDHYIELNDFSDEEEY